MKNNKIRIWTYILGIIPIVVLAFLYTHLPNQVPMHWGVDGVVDYNEKWQLWMLFSMGLLMAVLFDILPKIDPKKKNYEKFGKYYDLFAIGMVIFMGIMDIIVIIESFYPNSIPVGRIVVILVGILFILLGNIMPKVKTNFYMGIRTPWTISNVDVWNRVHRLGGKMMFVMGILVMASGFWMNDRITMGIIIAGAACITIVPLVMSYIWYRKLEK